MDARETLAMYVAGGNMRDADPSPEMDKEKAKTLRERLDALRNGEAPPAATDAPSDFRADIAAREAAAAADEAAKRGKDIIRWHQDNPVMKRIYQAHDAVVSLPAPGGLGIIILIIFVFFLVLIGVTSKGETRALMLWEVLLGQKEVEPLDIPVVDAGSGSTQSEASAIASAVAAGIGVGIKGALGLGDSTNVPNAAAVASMAIGAEHDSFELYVPSSSGGPGYE